MLKEERHRYIIDRINRDSRIYVTALSEELKVSDDTLRRDLVELENLGLLTKVHGGAVAKSDISIKFLERLNTSTSIKQEMAAKLVPLFKEGDVISVFQMVQSIYPDWVIVGVSDIHPQKGLTTSDREEAVIKRCMLKQGGKRVILATGEKLNTARNYHVASLAEIDYIVTENSKVDYIKQHWPSYTYQVL